MQTVPYKWKQMPSHVCAREMCGEGCVTIVFLVGANIVDSWAHGYASTRLHSLQKQQWQDPRLAEGWSCTDSGCTRAFLSTGFCENCFSFLLIPYPFHHGSYDLLT